MIVESPWRRILLTTTLMMAFTVAGIVLLAWTFHRTKDQIAANEKAYLLRSLHQLVPANTHDNDLSESKLEKYIPELFAGKSAIYVARRNNATVAHIVETTAADGYSGKIKMLIGIDNRGALLGVRVINHRETPGLGDAIEVSRSPWIYGFDGKSLQNPQEKKWRVKKDQGAFDEITSATITSRAVVKTVYKTLKYMRNTDTTAKRN